MLDTPNMGLREWNLGPDFFDHAALALNWTRIDQHDHTTGKGLQIPRAGIQNLAIDQSKLANLAVGTAQIQNGAITTIKLVDDAVTVDKIADAAVLTQHLADNAVTTAKIAAGQITSAKMASGNRVTGSRITDTMSTPGLYTHNISVGFVPLAIAVTPAGYGFTGGYSYSSGTTFDALISGTDANTTYTGSIAFSWIAFG